ncbi:hypothetical protein BYT27DRAFT_6780875 [Phlegmacium glaucopus]|nr:hypothetical protein BYT27DRAFT_6780875 [Phlegmacium glaucopus]
MHPISLRPMVVPTPDLCINRFMHHGVMHYENSMKTSSQYFQVSKTLMHLDDLESFSYAVTNTMVSINLLQLRWPGTWDQNDASIAAAHKAAIGSHAGLPKEIILRLTFGSIFQNLLANLCTFHWPHVLFKMRMIISFWSLLNLPRSIMRSLRIYRSGNRGFRVGECSA